MIQRIGKSFAPLPRLFAVLTLAAGVLLCAGCRSLAHQNSSKPLNVLVFYSTRVERAHVNFANDALKFFAKLSTDKHFTYEATTDWSKLNAANLKNVQLVVWLNDQPQSNQQRKDFETYMEGGGAWLGFHVAAYNDRSSHWPWFVQFLGGGVFERNNWPTLPATLIVDDNHHPVTRRLPPAYLSPANEWYQWKPSPRANKDVRVLLTLSPKSYPIGIKDIMPGGDTPVVWTNTKYHMLYMNMGHGPMIFDEPVQNGLIADSVLWLGGRL